MEGIGLELDAMVRVIAVHCLLSHRLTVLLRGDVTVRCSPFQIRSFVAFDPVAGFRSVWLQKCAGMMRSRGGARRSCREAQQVHRRADRLALKQAELGVSVEEVCRKMGISDATLCVWRKKYGGIGPSELRRLRQLEEENRKLKQIVADLSLDKAMLQAVVAKKGLRPSHRRALVPELMQRFGCSERNALRVVRMSPSSYRYTITDVRVHYGYWRVHVLLRREGHNDNVKRVYRLYREEAVAALEAATAQQGCEAAAAQGNRARHQRDLEYRFRL